MDHGSPNDGVVDVICHHMEKYHEFEVIQVALVEFSATAE